MRGLTAKLSAESAGASRGTSSLSLSVGWLVYSCGRRAAIMREHALVRLNLCLLVTCCVANWDAVTGGRSFSPSAPSSGAPANSELAQALEYPPPGFLQGPKPECILHVGPHKTGTSSLQALLFQRASMLQSDGWHQPPNLPGTTLDTGEYAHIPGFKGGVNLALFLQTRTPNTSEPIWLAFASWVQAKARRRENIVLSSEEFDRTSAHISLLARVLNPLFRTTVVVGYRHFYEWAPSVYRQISTTPGPVDGERVHSTFSRWLTPQVAGTIGTGRYRGLLFTNELVRRYSWLFGDIRVLPLDAAFLNVFVCSFLNASRTCASLYDRPPQRMNTKHTETSDYACASESSESSRGECLERSVRNTLLERTIRSYTEIALLVRPALKRVNMTEIVQGLDALGLCFCHRKT